MFATDREVPDDSRPNAGAAEDGFGGARGANKELGWLDAGKLKPEPKPPAAGRVHSGLLHEDTAVV